MTETRRIIVNIVATYGRSLFAMGCGIFTSRWVLMALGQEGYGLWGVVGGLTVFISFLNMTLAAATTRYYSFAIGQARVDSSGDGLTACRKWFSIAMMMHTVVPVVLVCLGYPLGVWAIQNWLNIPSDRLVDSVWVLRFSCLSCLISMINVPYYAMYTAKQYIAELTVYSLVTTVINVVTVYYMASHTGDWLCVYALLMCLSSSLPQIIICMRARTIFPECRFCFKYCLDWQVVREYLSYAIWQLMGAVSLIVWSQTNSLVCNKAFDAKVNASMTIANTVRGQSGNLSSALIGAFSPVIISAYGAGDSCRAQLMTVRACKFSALLLLMFAIPLGLEMDYVLHLWLQTPPPYCVELSLCILGCAIMDLTTSGTSIIVNASGRIRLFQILNGLSLMLILPVSVVLLMFNSSLCSLLVAIVLVTVINNIARVIGAWITTGFSPLVWGLRIVFPLVVVFVLVTGVGVIPVILIGQSFLRLMLTSLICSLLFLGLAWVFVFNGDERAFVLSRLQTHISKINFI